MCKTNTSSFMFCPTELLYRIYLQQKNVSLIESYSPTVPPLHHQQKKKCLQDNYIWQIISRVHGCMKQVWSEKNNFKFIIYIFWKSICVLIWRELFIHGFNNFSSSGIVHQRYFLTFVEIYEYEVIVDGFMK